MIAMSQTTKETNRWRYAAHLGLFAGLFWGAVKIVFFYFEFTRVMPAFMLEPFYSHKFLVTWAGHFLGWFSFIILSLVASWLYAATLIKVKTPWMGMAYGALWWAFLYLLVGPQFEMIGTLNELGVNSILSDLCLFVLWGLFIGYSIAIEFNDLRKYEPTLDQQEKS